MEFNLQKCAAVKEKQPLLLVSVNAMPDLFQFAADLKSCATRKLLLLKQKHQTLLTESAADGMFHG